MSFSPLSGTPEFPLLKNFARETFASLGWGKDYMRKGMHFSCCKPSCTIYHLHLWPYLLASLLLDICTISVCLPIWSTFSWYFLRNIKSIYVILNLHWDLCLKMTYKLFSKENKKPNILKKCVCVYVTFSMCVKVCAAAKHCICKVFFVCLSFNHSNEKKRENKIFYIPSNLHFHIFIKTASLNPAVYSDHL